MSSPALAITFLTRSPLSGLHYLQILIAASAVLLLLCGVFAAAFWKPKIIEDANHSIVGFCTFFYASFLKPHAGDGPTDQQAALESFYQIQVWSWGFLHKDSSLPLPTNSLMFMMRPVRGYFVAAKICSG